MQVQRDELSVGRQAARKGRQVGLGIHSLSITNLAGSNGILKWLAMCSGRISCQLTGTFGHSLISWWPKYLRGVEQVPELAYLY